jgi:hypothetical protein
MLRINWAGLHRDRRFWGVVGLVVLLAALAVSSALSASADGDGEAAGQPTPIYASPTQASPPRPTRTASPSPRPPLQLMVFLECYLDEDQDRRDRFVVRIADDAELPDFTDIWEEAPVDCYGDGRRGGLRRPVLQSRFEM